MKPKVGYLSKLHQNMFFGSKNTWAVGTKLPLGTYF